MPSHITLASAIQWAFNFLASGVLWNTVSQLVKTKSDARYQLKQLAVQAEVAETARKQAEAQVRQAERDDVRDDGKYALERQKAEDERRKAAEDQRKQNDERADKQYKDACESRDYWMSQCKTAQAELDARNAKWVENSTSYPEISALIAIPGAVQCLRDHRDKRPPRSS